MLRPDVVAWYSGRVALAVGFHAVLRPFFLDPLALHVVVEKLCIIEVLWVKN